MEHEKTFRLAVILTAAIITATLTGCTPKSIELFEGGPRAEFNAGISLGLNASGTNELNNQHGYSDDERRQRKK